MVTKHTRELLKIESGHLLISEVKSQDKTCNLRTIRIIKHREEPIERLWYPVREIREELKNIRTNIRLKAQSNKRLNIGKSSCFEICL